MWAVKLGLRFTEVSVSYTPRTHAAGKKLRLRDGFQAMLTLWRYRKWRPMDSAALQMPPHPVVDVLAFEQILPMSESRI